MLSQVIFGDRLDFEPFYGSIRMFVNDVLTDEILQSGNIEWDIGRLMNRSYAE